MTGIWSLSRLILRRDRFVLPIWMLVFGLLPLSYASAIDEVYPTAEGLQRYHDATAATPALLGMVGPLFGASLGALTAWRTGTILAFFGIVSLLVVIRHTRAEEDAGRRDLVGAAVVGRHAPLAAALLVTFVADLLVGVLVALSLAGYGLPTVGSFALGLSFAAAGWVFAGVGAVAAQLSEGAGAARGIALGVLGTAFALRAAGDSSGPGGDVAWLSRLSPLGWVQQVRPFAGEQWWLLVLLAGVTAALAVAAGVLTARRDVGAGVLPARLGPAAASAGLSGPFGLAWRLQRGALLGWTLAMAGIGVVIGSSSRGIDSFVGSSEQVRQFIERLGGAESMQDAYLASTMGLFAFIAAGYAVQAALRMRSEEAAMRAEPVLATAVDRRRWAASHLVFALLGPVVVLVALGITMGLTSASSGEVAQQVGGTLAGALVTVPAVWVLAGIAFAGFGLLPRVSVPVAWSVFAVCAFLAFVGQLVGLDQRVLDLTPFTHVPRLPGGAFTATPLLWMLAVTAVLTAAGFIGFRRRDVG